MNKSTGDGSTGDWSTGDRSTGNGSTGDGSTGDWSTGDWSTGNGSTGNRSTGNRSTGDWSTGDYSMGSGSTGNRSTGYMSTGSWSTGDRSTGDFSIQERGYEMFDKPCTGEEFNADRPDWLYFSLTAWIQPFDMTDEEKEDNPTYLITLGYLKRISFDDAAFMSWKNTTDEDRKATLQLTNFNDDIFKHIFGFSAVEYLEGEGDE